MDSALNEPVTKVRGLAISAGAPCECQAALRHFGVTSSSLTASAFVVNSESSVVSAVLWHQRSVLLQKPDRPRVQREIPPGRRLRAHVVEAVVRCGWLGVRPRVVVTPSPDGVSLSLSLSFLLLLCLLCGHSCSSSSSSSCADAGDESSDIRPAENELPRRRGVRRLPWRGLARGTASESGRAGSRRKCVASAPTPRGCARQAEASERLFLPFL